MHLIAAAAETPQWNDAVNAAIPGGTTDQCLKDIRSYYLEETRRDFCINIQINASSTWSNSTLELSLGPSGEQSMAAKCLVEEQGANQSRIACTWQRYNWFTLVGDVVSGQIDVP